MRSLGLISLLAAAGVSCFPQDKSADIIVQVIRSDSLAARGVIERGKFDSMSAVAFETGGGAQVSNVSFSWTSSNPGIAEVTSTGPTSARVVGVTPGYVNITATPNGFGDAAPGTVQVRVSDAVAIDSIRQTVVPYGAKLTVFGVGVANIQGITMGPGELISDIFSFRGYKSGVSEVDWWVPFPAFPSRPVIRFAGGDSLKDTTLVQVLPYDVLEPSDWVPGLYDSVRAILDINGDGGPRTIAGRPALYYNPALFFEPGDSTTPGEPNYFNDWYSFLRDDTTQAVSYQLSVPSLSDSTFTYFSGSLTDYFSGTPGNWIVRLGQWYSCGNTNFYPDGRLQPASPLLAVQTIPGKQVEVLSFYQNPGRYTLQVVKGYVTTDPRIAPDRFESDDIWCRFTDQRFLASTDSLPSNPNRLHIVVGKTFGGWFDTLALEYPGALDVIRFRVQAPGPTDSVYLGIRALPFPGQADRAQFSAQIFPVSSFAPPTYIEGGGFDPNASSYPYYYPCPYSQAPICLYWWYSYPYGYGGSYWPNGKGAYLTAGDYYLVVADQAGNATRYSICIVMNTGTGCTAPGAPPLPAQPPAGAPRASGAAPPANWVPVPPPHPSSDRLGRRP